MAYSPIERGRLLGHPSLRAIATRHGGTPAQVVLARVLAHDGAIAIPKAGTPARGRENRAALELRLTKLDLAALDDAFPPPDGPRSLAMLESGLIAGAFQRRGRPRWSESLGESGGSPRFPRPLVSRHSDDLTGRFSARRS